MIEKNYGVERSATDISCPVCKFKGSVSDNLIPEGGKHVNCPRCKAKIFIRKPVVSLTGGEPAGPRPAGVRFVTDRNMVPSDAADPDAKAMRTRCESCGESITVPENKKMLVCPGCGANIVRQVIEEELEPGFIVYSVQEIARSFRSVFKGWGRYLKKPVVRRTLAAVLALGVAGLVFYGLSRSKPSPGGLFDKSIEITFPWLEAEPSGEDRGFPGNLVRIEITPKNEVTEEVRIYQIVFKDGGRSDYFRYYRHDRGIVYIMLPDGSGGSYELGYEDSDIRSIKRIRKVPGNVAIYGVN